jgi:caffeoyl-CoA O-methyltransferase
VTDLVDAGVERYAAEHTTPQPDALDSLYRETVRTLGHENMLSGPVVGRMLEMLVFALQPRLVLEIGTFSGYSAIAMAAGLPADGRIITCEADPEHAALARRAIAESPHAARIELREGDAHATVAQLDGPIDFVFIDAEKGGYRAYVEAVLGKLSERALIAVDNTLFHGTVLEPGEQEGSGRAVADFNDWLMHDERLVVCLLTVRDGITLIRRRPGAGVAH